MLQNRIKNFQPITSQPYETFVTHSKQNCIKDVKENENLYLKIGVLSKYKGSAYMEYENTKLICYVFPPQEPTKNSKNINLKSAVNCEFLITQYAGRSKNENRIIKQKSLSSTLKKALEPLICRQEFLSFKIRIYILVLEDGGNILSTALNCCGAALADGGIPIYDIFAASSLQSKYEGDIKNKDDDDTCNIITAYSKSNQVSECCHTGYVSFNKFKDNLVNTLSKNESVLLFVNNILINNVTKR